jgi:hypothetical protein
MGETRRRDQDAARPTAERRGRGSRTRFTEQGRRRQGGQTGNSKRQPKHRQLAEVVEEEEEEAGSSASPRRHYSKGPGRRRQRRCSQRQPKLLRQARVTGSGKRMIGCMTESRKRLMIAGRWERVMLARAG